MFGNDSNYIGSIQVQRTGMSKFPFNLFINIQHDFIQKLETEQMMIFWEEVCNKQLKVHYVSGEKAIKIQII